MKTSTDQLTIVRNGNSLQIVSGKNILKSIYIFDETEVTAKKAWLQKKIDNFYRTGYLK